MKVSQDIMNGGATNMEYVRVEADGEYVREGRRYEDNGIQKDVRQGWVGKGTRSLVSCGRTVIRIR